MKVESFQRTLDSLDDEHCFDGKIDPAQSLLIGDAKARTFKTCPYIFAGTFPIQTYGLVGNEVVGSINHFCYNIIADGSRYLTAVGDSLYVYDKYRSTMFGVSLLDGLKNLSRDHIVMGCRYSPQAQGVLRLLRYRMFRLNEYKYIKHSMGIVLTRSYAKFPHFVLDCVYAVIRWVVWMLTWLKTHQLSVREISCLDDSTLNAMADLVKRDVHRFREDVTVEWLRWTLSNDFQVDVTKKAYGVYVSGILVGFFLVRLCGSGKGEGKIFEWQLDSRYNRQTIDLMLRVARLCVQKCDYLTLSLGDEDNQNARALKMLLCRRTEQVVALWVAKDSPLTKHEGYGAFSNWRIRPGMGDACFW